MRHGRHRSITETSPECKLFGESGKEPSPRVSPVPISGCGGDPHHLRGLLESQAAKEPQLDQLGLVWGFLSELRKGCVEVKQSRRIVIEGDRCGVEIDFGQCSLTAAATLLCGTSAGMIDEHPPHGFRRGGEEVPAMVPLHGAALIRVWPEQAEVCLMDKGRGLQSVAGAFGGKSLCGEEAEFLVDQRQKAGRSRGIGRCRIEEAGDGVAGCRWWIRGHKGTVGARSKTNSTGERHPIATPNAVSVGKHRLSHKANDSSLGHSARHNRTQSHDKRMPTAVFKVREVVTQDNHFFISSIATSKSFRA